MNDARFALQRLAAYRMLVIAMFAGLLFALGPLPHIGQPAAAAADGPSAVYFPVTGHNVADPFLAYWRTHGALAIFGYPLTELIERDGMQVQYFERARFELHPEYVGT